MYMEHKGTVALMTDRLVLRKFDLEDAEYMYKNWASEEEVVKFLTWPAHKTVNVSRNILSEWVKSYEENSYYQWAIVLKEYDNQPIGTISVVKYDNNTKSVEVGYCIGTKFWGKGIVSEAFEVVIKFLIEEVGVNRIEAKCDTKNHSSAKVMIKNGLKYEGTMREFSLNNQGLCDCELYAILAKDYFGIGK